MDKILSNISIYKIIHLKDSEMGGATGWSLNQSPALKHRRNVPIHSSLTNNLTKNWDRFIVVWFALTLGISCGLGPGTDKNVFFLEV